MSALITLSHLVISQEVSSLFFEKHGERGTLRVIKSLSHDQDLAYQSIRLLNQMLKFNRSKTTLQKVFVDLRELLRS